MNNKIVKFEIHILNDNIQTLFKIYEISITENIIKIKDMILNDLISYKIINSDFNYLNLNNITEKIYKDFGKLFFDKGILPSTIDNYKLSEFTTENRIFSFIALPITIDNNINKKNNKSSGILNKIIKDDMKKKNEFILFEEDFPPLS